MNVGGYGTGFASSPNTLNSEVAMRNGGAYEASTNKRKRSSADPEHSPGSQLEGDDAEEQERRKTPGVKRACNECRQQKLRCDVVQDPFTVCSRCSRLKLECKIQSNFKRIGKRSKHAEMEKQIENLTRKLQIAKAQGYTPEDDDDIESPITNGIFPASVDVSAFRNNDEAASSLIHLKQSGGASYTTPIVRYAHQLEDVGVTSENALLLFHEYFTNYHQFLPFLNPLQEPEQYFMQSPLLYWAIISVAARRTTVIDDLLSSLAGPISRLLWITVGGVPSNHHAVKALCLLCTWPLPTSTTSSDPTHILGGVMMKSATNIGLHRPRHTQDFSRTRVDYSNDELHDRIVTWAVCNIVAQTLGTGYGQPASTLYDWTLASSAEADSADPFSLSPELDARLQIEKFCDKISKECYSNATDPIGLSGDEIRSHLTRVFKRDHNDQVHLASKPGVSPLIELWHKAAGVHLRLSAFFAISNAEGYLEDLMNLFRATSAFLDYVFQLEETTQFLKYGTNYLCQMVVVSGFVILKLFSSFFAGELPYQRGKILFLGAVNAVRTMSVGNNNDLAWKLAELMLRMWDDLKIVEQHGISVEQQQRSAVDNSLTLKVRCRHSMSLVYDSLWKWREEYTGKGRGNFDGNPKNTNLPYPKPESQTPAQSLETMIPPLDHTTQHDMQQLNNLSTLPLSGTMGLPSSGMNVGLTDGNYEYTDPLNWMLEGLVDFSYGFSGMDSNGMG